MMNIKIVTTSSGNAAIDKWWLQHAESITNNAEIVQAADLQSLMAIIGEQSEDVVVYTQPVIVLHKDKFDEFLAEVIDGQADGVAIMEQGSTSLNMQLFALRPGIIKDLREVAVDVMKTEDQQWSVALMLNMGRRLNVLVNTDSQYLYHLGVDCIGRGMYATDCGGKDICKIIEESKLDIGDVMTAIMEGAK